ncbi:MAG TPA: IS200/IS605 family transposase [Holosporales bacterium]|nr:IS200/IS605 family transposase [Holosporales bacterium]
MEVLKLSHSTYSLKYHVVWVCKYRRKILNPGVCSYIRKTLPGLLKEMLGVTIEEIGFDKDHLHMLMTIPPKYSISSVMGRLKSQLSSKMRKFFPWLGKVYWNENIVWSPGYFVSSVGLDEETIRKYVEHQGQQDSGQLRQEL